MKGQDEICKRTSTWGKFYRSEDEAKLAHERKAIKVQEHKIMPVT